MTMEKYTNAHEKECYRNAGPDDAFSADLFHEVMPQIGNDYQVAMHSNLGSITVLDRETGYGYGVRDVETGFRDMTGAFWLASGNRDVRYAGCKTMGEAVEWVKQMANTCIPERDESAQT